MEQVKTTKECPFEFCDGSGYTYAEVAGKAFKCLCKELQEEEEEYL